jgi:hypothetical protein
MLDSLTDQTLDATFPDAGSHNDPPAVAKDDAPPYLNSVDATVGQPIVDRVQIRKHELEAALAALPDEDVRKRGDLQLALSTVTEMLTGDLGHVAAVTTANMSQWLERNKHLAENAAVAAINPVVVTPTRELGPVASER